jgi:hypothetical protein
MKKIAATALVLASTLSHSALAAQYKVTFAADGFQPMYGSLAAPETTLTGSITFEAVSLGAPVLQISAVELTIAGKVFDAAEVGAEQVGGGYRFGGTVFGIGGTGFGVPDFALEANNLCCAWRFIYTTNEPSTGWFASSIVYALAPVPEPAPLALFLLGIVPLAIRHHVRKSVVSSGEA